MSDHGDSKWTSGFVVGFLVGVLVSLGIGGSYVLIQQRQLMAERERAHMEAEVARQEAVRQRLVAEEARGRTVREEERTKVKPKPMTPLDVEE